MHSFTRSRVYIICRERSEIVLRVTDINRQSALMRNLTVLDLRIFAFSPDRVVHHRCLFVFFLFFFGGGGYRTAG